MSENVDTKLQKAKAAAYDLIRHVEQATAMLKEQNQLISKLEIQKKQETENAESSNQTS